MQNLVRSETLGVTGNGGRGTAGAAPGRDLLYRPGEAEGGWGVVQWWLAALTFFPAGCRAFWRGGLRFWVFQPSHLCLRRWGRGVYRQGARVASGW